MHKAAVDLDGGCRQVWPYILVSSQELLMRSFVNNHHVIIVLEVCTSVAVEKNM